MSQDEEYEVAIDAGMCKLCMYACVSMLCT